MCGGLGKSHANPPHVERMSINSKEFQAADTVESGFCLLEMAANNDLHGFRKCVEQNNAKVDAVGTWYARQNGARRMVFEQRTPVMIAALYGSLDVLAYILSFYALFGGEIHYTCGSDGSSALHCAAAGGSPYAADAVKLLLDYGADANVLDARGRRPSDVVTVSFRRKDIKFALHELLDRKASHDVYVGENSDELNMKVACQKLLKKKLHTDGESDTSDEPENCAILPSLKYLGLNAAAHTLSIKRSLSSSGFSTTSGSSSALSPPASPKSPLTNQAFRDDREKSRSYPMDPYLPDIKHSFYTTDEFRMYSFKIRPCSRAYSHDWTECPFAHPGENARRRDPRKFHYSCVPCPDFRKGACEQGEACEFAHGIFESWLHPAQYRTRLCKDGTGCSRRVCFFAHNADELRPLYIATGSGLPSPISSSAFTDVSTMSPPCSPVMMPPFSSLHHPLQNAMHGSLRTPPISPSSSFAGSLNALWSQQTVPVLHFPGASLQASRLRTAFTAHDVLPSDGSASSDFDERRVHEFRPHSLSMQARLNAAVAVSGKEASSEYKSLGLTMAPANLEELFALENMQLPGNGVYEAQWPSHMEDENSFFSQKQLQFQHIMLEDANSEYASSPSPTTNINCLSTVVATRSGLDGWGSPTGKPEWGMQQEDLSKLRKSASFQLTDSADSCLSRMQKEGSLGIDSDGHARTNMHYVAQEEQEGRDTSSLAMWMDDLSLEQIIS